MKGSIVRTDGKLTAFIYMDEIEDRNEIYDILDKIEDEYEKYEQEQNQKHMDLQDKRRIAATSLAEYIGSVESLIFGENNKNEDMDEIIHDLDNILKNIEDDIKHFESIYGSVKDFSEKVEKEQEKPNVNENAKIKLNVGMSDDKVFKMLKSLVGGVGDKDAK